MKKALTKSLSLLMCIIMVGTMFCGFAKTEASAQSAKAAFYLVSSDVRSDGTFTVRAYAKDYSYNGWYWLSGSLTWDSNIEPVLFDVDGEACFGDASDFADLCGWLDASYPSIYKEYREKRNVKTYVPIDAARGFAVGFENLEYEPLSFSKSALIENVGDPYYFGYNDKYGMFLGEFYFRLKSGATSGAVYMSTHAALEATGNGADFADVSSQVITAKVRPGEYTSTDVNTAVDIGAIDTDGLKCDVDLGTLSGPTLSIFGHEFELISMDASFELGSISNISVNTDVDYDEKTVKVILGYGASADLTSDGAFNEEYAKIKQLYKYVTGGTYKDWNGFQHFKSSIFKNVSKATEKVGIDASIKTAGFLEFSYETGNLIPVESGIVIEGSLGTQFTYQPNIFYITAGLKGSVNMFLGVKFSESSGLSFSQLATDFGLEANVGIGAGTKKFKVYAEGGLIGDIHFKLSSDFNTYWNANATLGGALYVEAKLGLLEYSKKWRYDDFELLDKTIPIALMCDIEGESEGDSELSCKPMGRDYAYSPTSDTYIPIQTFALDDDSIAQSEFYQSEVYPYGYPTYIELDDGRRMLFFIGDDGTKADKDRTSLMYSIYENGAWSIPDVVYESGTYSDMPAIYSDGEKVYIVWQIANSTLADDVTEEEMLASVDLHYTVYDGKDFSQPVCIGAEGNTAYESGHSVVFVGDQAIVSWIENSENDVFGNSGTDTLMLSVANNDAVSIDTHDSIIEQIAASRDGIGYVYYVVSEDVDSLYRYCVDDGQVELIDTGDAISQLSEENGNILYVKDSSVVLYDGEIVAETGLVGIDNYTYITNGDKEVMFTLASSGLKNALYYCEKDSETGLYGDWELFADFDTNIRNYSPIIDDNGIITCAFNSVSVDEAQIDGEGEVYGSADLFVMGRKDHRDVVLNYAYYEDDEIVAGENLSISYNVTNNSNVMLDGFVATLYDAEGQVINTQEVTAELDCRESGDFTIDYALPASMGKHNLRLEISSDDDACTDNNTTDFTVGYSDVEITDVIIKKNGNEAKFIARLTNNGFDTAEKIIVDAMRVIDGEKVSYEQVSVESIAAGEAVEVSFSIPVDMMVAADETMNAVYFECSSSSEESNLVNNEFKMTYSTLIDTGDINDDGVTNIIDITIAAQYIAQDGAYGTFDLTEASLTYADANGDGVIDQLDLNAIAAIMRANG